MKAAKHSDEDEGEKSNEEEDIPAADTKEEEKPAGGTRCLGVTILIFIVVLLFLKYQEGQFKRSGEPITDDLYEALGLDSTATPLAIKQKFRALSKVYHPDRNPNCEDCQERFNSIVQAYEVLSDAERRDAYDNSYSRGKKITSHTHQLTAANYNRLVSSSFDYWVVQVYRDGDEVCEKFSPVWEQVAGDLEGMVKFGRVNADKESQLLPSMPFKIKVYPSVFTTEQAGPVIFSLKSMFDPRELTKMIKEAIPNGIQMVEWVNLQEALNGDITAVAVFFREKADTPFAYKLYANRHRFDFQFLQVVPSEVSTVRQTLKVPNKATFAVFYKVQGELKSLVITEKLTESLIETVLLQAQRQSWPSLYSDNFSHLCRGSASLCLLSLIEPDSALLQLSQSTKKDYQFTRVTPDLHSFPIEFTYPVVIVHSVTGDYVPFESSSKALSFLKSYSPEEDSDRWVSGVELEGYLHYRGYALWREGLNLMFSWGGFGALTLLYVSYKILF